MPARASMMTGQYVCEHGVWNNLAQADPAGPSHVRNIRDAGYHTALIGKTYLWIHDSWVRGDRYTHARDFIPVQNDWGFEDVHELHGPLASIRNDSEYTDYLAEKGLLETHRNYQAKYYANWAAGKAKPWEEPPCPLPDEGHDILGAGAGTEDGVDAGLAQRLDVLVGDDAAHQHHHVLHALLMQQLHHAGTKSQMRT